MIIVCKDGCLNFDNIIKFKLIDNKILFYSTYSDSEFEYCEIFKNKLNAEITYKYLLKKIKIGDTYIDIRKNTELEISKYELEDGEKIINIKKLKKYLIGNFKTIKVKNLFKLIDNL